MNMTTIDSFVEEISGKKPNKSDVTEFNPAIFISTATDYSAFSMLSKGCMIVDAKLNRLDESIRYLNRLGRYAAKMNGGGSEARSSIKNARAALKLEHETILNNSGYGVMYTKCKKIGSEKKPESYKSCGNYVHWLPTRIL
jgi:hypothetical protein